ncbi:MAG: aminotransferase class V-fold PLP-dependent enzyme [Candidatus Bathyarchaeota archaeon]|jgi:selenocysteine lyase/cysteine desulfurase
MKKMEKIRAQFPITENKIFMNHAGQSPLPQPVADAIHRYVNDFSNFGTTTLEWTDGGKSFFAKLIGANPKEIAFIENTSVGLNIVANVLHYPPGSKIVTTDLEYPSVVYPWLRKALGVKVHYVRNVDGKILPEDMEKAVDDTTVAVVVSHVEYVNGFRNDLKTLSKIAHDNGAFLVVDAIQSIGAMEVDVKSADVDFLASSCYKWLLSPPGAGYLYVKEELIEKLEPPFTGWASVKQEVFETIDFWDIWSLRLSETASRFEIGSPSFISLIGATEAMKMLLKFGIWNIQKRILDLTKYLIESLKSEGFELQTPEDPQYRSGIINFKIDNPLEVCQNLTDKGVIVSARAHGIRVSPHFYNTKEEIDQLIEEIKQF